MTKRFSSGRLTKARGERSFEFVAAHLGVSHQTIRNWESGKGEPSSSQLQSLALLFDRPLEWFFERQGAA